MRSAMEGASGGRAGDNSSRAAKGGREMEHRIGWINIFVGRDNHRYPSGIVHRSKADALAAQNNPTLEGRPIAVVKIEWDEPIGNPWP